MALALLVGATVQSLVGLGLGLVAAPVVALVDPELLPEVTLWLACTYPAVTLATERSGIDWGGLAWSMPTRVVGTVVGVVAVASLSGRLLGVVVALMVLAAVLLTWRAVRIPLNRGTLVAAGFVSGLSGTTTSIGGPPLAILYQHRPPQQIRTTMAVYFMGGAALSLVGLGIAGELGVHRFLLALALSPILPLGALLGTRLRPRLPEARVRPAVLVVCAASSLVLLGRTLLG